MKITEVRTYQAVKFQGNVDTFFSTTKRDMPDLVIENLAYGVSIKSPKDWIIVPYPNVAYIKPESVVEKDVSKSKSKAAI